MTEKAPTRPRRRRPSGKLKSERIQEDHLQTAASALRLASRSLEAAVERFETLLEAGIAHQHAALLLFTAVSLRSLLETHVEPARRTLEVLTADAPADDGAASPRAG